jgi:hypothetical protein
MAASTMDDEFHDDIDSLEQRIEALTAETARCRKFAAAARVMMAGGAVAIVLALTAGTPFGSELLIGGLAALIGGIVLMGSNAATRAQTEGALQAAETMRSDLIARMELRLVGEERPTLH